MHVCTHGEIPLLPAVWDDRQGSGFRGTSLEFVAGETVVHSLGCRFQARVWPYMYDLMNERSRVADLIEPRACAGIDGPAGPHGCIAREE